MKSSRRNSTLLSFTSSRTAKSPYALLSIITVTAVLLSCLNTISASPNFKSLTATSVSSTTTSSAPSRHFARKRRRSPSSSSLSSNTFPKSLLALSSYEKDSINAWNVRSLSSISLSAQQPPFVDHRNTLDHVKNSNNISDVSSTNNNNDNNNHHHHHSTNGLSRRRRGRRSNHENIQSILFTRRDSSSNSNSSSRPKKNQKQTVATVNDHSYNEEDDYTPSIQEMKANLGPIGLLVANSVEVGIATAGSYISGGLFGYGIGGVMGIPSLFTGSNGVSNGSIQPVNSNVLKEFGRRMGNLNSKAFAQGKSWASLSAAFSGFHALTRVCRGGEEDRWNSIIGSACAGAYFSRNGECVFPFSIF